jgi:hypothetical protein
MELHLLIVRLFGRYTIQAKRGVGRHRDGGVGGSSRSHGMRLYRIHHPRGLGLYRVVQQGRLRPYGTVVSGSFGRFGPATLMSLTRV